jgi:SNF2 family DNA or RNA helicase
MKFEARPWQKPMISHILHNQRVNLWADMGSGKTSAVLTALDILQMCGSNFFPALVLAPLRVARDVWPADGRKFDHLRGMTISAITGTADERRRALWKTADIYTINYENIPWLVEECNGKWPFLTVVADESTRLKGFKLRMGTKRAAALAQVARKTQRWINLTGTPSPNGLKDLWGQTWFLDFGQRLGLTWTAFKDRWFDYDPYTAELSPKPHAQKEIQDLLRDVTLTIQMKDWVDLKAPVKSNVYVDLPPKVMAQYKELEKKLFLELSEDVEITALTAASKSTKCLQFAAGACYHNEDRDWVELHHAKLDALESIVEETAGANLLVAYWWKHDVERILKRFPKARVLRTEQDIKDWNAGRISMGLGHPQSMGHGLNLQHGGHHIVFFSDWWNLESKLQIIERIGPVRQMQAGFDRAVYQYQIVARGTIEELVVERHETKAATQDLLLNAMKKERQ